MTGYDALRDGIATVMSTVSITDLTDVGTSDGWAEKFTSPPKQFASFPVWAIRPVSDAPIEREDSETDRDTFTIAVYLYDTFVDGPASEDRLSAIADRVRDAFRSERVKQNPPPLGSSEVKNMTFAGTWGFDPERGHRFYQLTLTIRVVKTLD